MGISSYSEFPGKLTNPYDSKYHEKEGHNYENMVSTWLHCFRNPKDKINKNLPMLLMSESDFKDWETLKPTSEKKIYDFIYICLDDNKECNPGWQSFIRNWELAKKCIGIMCNDFGLKGCLVGRNNCILEKGSKDKVEIFGLLSHNDFLKKIRQSKFIFVPNSTDASPRVVTESLCLNLPVLMNYNITGGWKYINDETGEFFSDKENFKIALRKLLKNFHNYQPRKWFVNNYGKKKSSEKLAGFVNIYYPNVIPKNPKQITIAI